MTPTLDMAGRYVGDHDAVRPRLWFEPASGERVRLETLDRTSPDGPNWGYRGSGPNATAEAILFHATGDMTVVELCSRDLAHDIVAHLPFNQPFTVPAARVQQWLLDHGVDLAAPWGPQGVMPVVRHEPTTSDQERYVVTLDGWDTLTIELNHHAEQARVTIRDLDDPRDPVFDQTLTYAYPDEADHSPTPGARVAVEVMPFGGWMITADHHDLVILDRDRDQPDRLHVRARDRTHADDEFAFDESLRHRQLPDTATALATADRLRRFTRTPTPSMERSLTR
ncbi:MAG: hypothetical protein QOI95_105 [Acidimicrobiaceae bacterium]|jgi:hypothetical protein